MLRETSAASTIAASTATGVLAAPARGAWVTMSANTIATQSARLIRKPLRIKASFAPPGGSIGRRRASRKGRAQSLQIEEWRRVRRLPSFLARTRAATRGFGLLEENARGEPNQGRSEKDRRERCVCCPLKRVLRLMTHP